MNTLMSSAAFAALCALAPISQAATIEINFDTVAAGSKSQLWRHLPVFAFIKPIL